MSDAADEEPPPYLEASRRGDGSLDRGADACEGLAASGWPEGPLG